MDNNLANSIKFVQQMLRQQQLPLKRLQPKDTITTSTGRSQQQRINHDNNMGQDEVELLGDLGQPGLDE